MSTSLLRPAKCQPGDKVAVVSPSFAAPGFAPEVHEQAMRRLTELTGLVPVEYPTTRRLNASPEDRAADLMAAFTDPKIRAVLSSVGGDDQIRVIGHLDAEAVRRDPKPFLGYSDNSNLHSFLWNAGVASFYGGSTQVHLGPGSGPEAEHVASLRAALLDGGRLELTNPAESEDFGVDWRDPRALTEDGEREESDPWVWAGPDREVTGPTWGGCIEVLQWVLAAGRLPADNERLRGGVLLLETSEEVIPATEFRWHLNVLGERGILGAVDAVLVARPPASNFERRPDAQGRAKHRRLQSEVAIEVIGRYNPEAVVCTGIPFGHTKPQWIVPHGGEMTVDGVQRRVWADYS